MNAVARVGVMGRGNRRFRLTAVVLLLMMPLLAAVAAKADDTTAVKRDNAATAGKLVVKNIALNTYVRQLDGQWLGNLMASDGNVYFFSSSHSNKHGAAMFRFDPRTKDIKMLCEDISRACGEDPTKTIPQGKVHSAIIEADGRLYFGTHLAEYTPLAEAAYPGGHFVGYELATGKFRDYGIVRPRYTIYAGVNIDAAHKLGYVFVTPFAEQDKRKDGCHLYRIRLDSGEKEDLGLLARGNNSCYTMVIDWAGNCWLPVRGALYRVRPDGRQPEGFMDTGIRWAWAAALPGGKACVYAAWNQLRLFDLTTNPTREDATKTLHDVGPTNLGMTLDSKRVYYVVRANGARWDREGGAYKDLHLFSATLDPEAKPGIIDHGLLADQNGRWPWKIESLSTDGQGHIYMVGAWHVEGEEEKTLGVYKNAEGGYCGQFFGEVDLAPDLTDAKAPTAVR